MIGLLDPALFLLRPDREVEHDVDLILRTCRKHDVSVVPLEEYWPDLWTELARPLELRLRSSSRRGLQELRKFGSSTGRYVAPLPANAGRFWQAGFQQLFGHPALGASWEEPRGIGHRQILCVHHPRNLQQRWTARFDWRLPCSSDGARYPFCPPDAWWKGSTVAHRTVESKPAWVDHHGNGWARPNISRGAGYHWDVFIQSAGLQETVGLAQINVVEFGAPEREGRAGHMHHAPDAKLGKLTGVGWSCQATSGAGAL